MANETSRRIISLAFGAFDSHGYGLEFSDSSRKEYQGIREVSI
jgi:hypothetical protein